MVRQIMHNLGESYKMVGVEFERKFLDELDRRRAEGTKKESYLVGIRRADQVADTFFSVNAKSYGEITLEKTHQIIIGEQI